MAMDAVHGFTLKVFQVPFGPDVIRLKLFSSLLDLNINVLNNKMVVGNCINYLNEPTQLRQTTNTVKREWCIKIYIEQFRARETLIK